MRSSIFNVSLKAHRLIREKRGELVNFVYEKSKTLRCRRQSIVLTSNEHFL